MVKVGVLVGVFVTVAVMVNVGVLVGVFVTVLVIVAVGVALVVKDTLFDEALEHWRYWMFSPAMTMMYPE
jgi:cadmium resistance protein CadD (predicted permease)